MAFSFDKAFGIHQYTLGVRAKRAEVLSSNIANADTPGFKARDINFAQALQDAQHKQGFGLVTTSEKHFALNMDAPGTVQYRNPLQPDTGDGNTVDVQQERSEFLRNSLEYQTSLEFMNRKISGLLKALKGEQ
ncbi:MULTISPECIES: flagellar basal body rod protein FlgB [Aeromonas]|uniref:Flagellar basal body rod protein FlgB n=1 Tax=Aeromonas veronii AMC34 TaxID=1073383 RepID=K1IZE9_AERVE|nr:MULTISPECIES: flagellar basal body rod protein FlgB [Aeromonas]EKB19468.1 flagellar basal-body rod protein FlgB [Aeromonas veronii AMC34]MCF5763884.1 flagellar basal body rod protein FlgB [Aeromonas veronii]MCX4043122.1 flagellar basal body rod protein FlgB [Aeromonas veronii]QWZ83002.1 flagellar basal body rod protein FlgB [Aeromonas sp. FDAARGOS 1414]QXB29406.1 flagellar basal body rod protein FlgB [Aeromonas sp. FDAARGOS 1405]